MSQRYFIKAVGVTLTYCAFVYVKLAITKSQVILLGLDVCLILLLYFWLRRDNLLSQKVRLSMIGDSLLLGVGMALSFAMILPFYMIIDVADTGLYEVDYDWYLYVKVMVSAPIMEELVFRGIIFKDFSRNYSLKFAVIASALIFALLHPQSLGVVFLHGVVIAYVMYRTSSIIYPMVIHVTINTFNFGFKGTNFVMVQLASIFSVWMSILLTILLALSVICCGVLLIRKHTD